VLPLSRGAARGDAVLHRKPSIHPRRYRHPRRRVEL